MNTDFIIEQSIKERTDILKMIDTLFPDIEKYIYLENFEKLNFKVPEEMSLTSKIFNGPALMRSLAINASQQFCFWLDPNKQNIRSLASSDFENCFYPTVHTIITKKAMTLRKERLQILDSFNNYYLREDSIDDILSMDIFNYDFFRKKKNLLLMMMIRYKKELYYKDLDHIGFKETINPAIDYQIPKILNYFRVITYPTKINEKIQYGILIEKDSIEEFFIRSVAYKALIMIQEQYGYNQVELDTFMWYNRNNFNIPKEFKHHCTLTEDY